MAYIGNTPAESFASFEKQVFTIVNSQTAYTLNHAVTNENEIRLVVNNVVQEPGSGKAFTASGTTLTLSAALVNGTDEMYCVFLGRALQTVNAPNASVGSDQTAPTIITGQTAETSIATDDTILIHDTSASALRKMTRANFVGSTGKILNVYQVRTNTAVDVTSTSYVDIGLSQAVTPVSSSSKFLLRPNVHYSTFGGGEGFNLIVNRAISGGATSNINDFPTNGAYLRYQDANANFYDYFGYEWLDEPATASAITYKLQAKVTSSGSVKFSGYNSQTYSMLTIMEVGA